MIWSTEEPLPIGRSRRVTWGFLLALAVGLGCSAVLYVKDRGRTVLYEKESEYNHILVEEWEPGFRALLFSRDGGIQSIVKLGDPGHLELPYARTMLVGLGLVEEPRRMLVVGLGGGSIPMFLHRHYPEARIDAVDIDPDVLAVAREYFEFREDDRLVAHVADGRKFVEACTTGYDLIFLDAYGDDYIPYHLATREFLLAVKRALRPGGAVVGNVWSPRSNPLHDSMLRTYQDVFDEIYRFDVRSRGNKIFVAQTGAKPLDEKVLTRKARAISRAQSFRFDLGAEVAYGYRLETNRKLRAPVLLDKDRDKHEKP